MHQWKNCIRNGWKRRRKAEDVFFLLFRGMMYYKIAVCFLLSLYNTAGKYTDERYEDADRGYIFRMKDMKTQIADTFSELLEKEDLDKITVTKLIEACQISRQTFYYHFHDIMDVLEWTFRRATHELLEKSLNESERINALLAYLQFVKKHRKKLKRLVDSRKWYQIEGMMVDAVAVYLEKMAQSRPREVQVSYEEMQIMLRFYACGMVGVLVQCMEEGKVDEERVLVDEERVLYQIERIITGKVFPGNQEQ